PSAQLHIFGVPCGLRSDAPAGGKWSWISFGPKCGIFFQPLVALVRGATMSTWPFVRISRDRRVHLHTHRGLDADHGAAAQIGWLDVVASVQMDRFSLSVVEVHDVRIKDRF